MNRDSDTRGFGFLVADDHAISRRYIAAALRQSDWHVKQAATPRAALSIALGWLPRVILIDVNLGHANGFELARSIRDQWPKATEWPRIVMLSADPPDPRQMKRCNHFVDGFLLKPVSVASLLALVNPAGQHPVSAQGSREPSSELCGLFRQELSAQLGPLDRHIATRDLAAAGGILHQLIASSGLCREHRLERKLRSLDAACRNGAGASELGQEYFSLLIGVRDFLAPESLPGSK
jgi:CheY-like chemotaxis protein